MKRGPLPADPLTGLPGRTAFDRRLDEEFYRAERHGQPPALMLIDVDHFASFNEEFGEETGDEVLKTVVRLIEEQRRASDFFARYRHGVFAMLLSNTPAEGAGCLADRLRRVMAETPAPYRWITLTIGVAVWSEQMPTPDTFLAQAESALREAKLQGRNRVVEAPPYSAPAA